MMTTSADGIAILHHAEQCRLKAYPDPASGGAPWTIGWGHTGAEVKPGLVWTQAQADAAFERRLRQEFEPGVRRMLSVPAAQCEFDALVSLAYNIGVSRLAGSTLIKRFNTGDVRGAAAQFLAWKFAAGKDCSVRANRCWGVWRRRHMEQARFIGMTSAEAIAVYEAMA